MIGHRPGLRPGLAVRLIVTLTGATAGFWLVAAIIAYFAIAHELDEVFDSALRETAESLAPLAAEMRGETDRIHRDIREEEDGDDGEEDDEDEHREYLVYQLRAASDGRVLMRSHDAPIAPFPVALESGYATEDDLRVYTRLSPGSAVAVQVAEPLSHRREASFEATLGLLTPLFILVPLSAALIWWTVRRTLAPLDRLKAEIGTRDGDRLTPLGLTDLPSELLPIAQSVDRLLDRIRRTLEAERNFAANSAHELRTPIAGALAQVQRLAAELPSGLDRDRAAAIETALRRLSGICEKLLQLARADAPAARDGDRASARTALTAVIEDMVRAEPGARERLVLSMETDLDPDWPIDLDSLGLILRNLIENALRHGAANEQVLVKLDRDGVVRVTNAGPVVPADRFTDLSRAFARGDTEARGSGLGLSIVRALIDRSPLTLTYLSPAPGRSDGVEAVLSAD